MKKTKTKTITTSKAKRTEDSIAKFIVVKSDEVTLANKIKYQAKRLGLQVRRKSIVHEGNTEAYSYWYLITPTGFLTSSYGWTSKDMLEYLTNMNQKGTRELVGKITEDRFTNAEENEQYLKNFNARLQSM